MIRLINTAALALLAASGIARAQSVHVLSSGDEAVDQAAVALLESAGFETTLGLEYWALTGAEDLSGYEAILALGGPNWGMGASFSEAAQQSLADFADAGGGIVFTEWFGYNGAVRGWTVLPELLPTVYQGYSSPETIEYTESNAPPSQAATVTCLVPIAMSVPADNFAGAEATLEPKAGATVFFDSVNTGAAGVAGWDVGEGRVAHFSSSVGVNQLTDASFSRLILNTIAWSTEAPVCKADIVRDGLLDLSDITAFVTAFTAGCD